VQYNIQDDAEINNSFPNLPISEGKDGAHSTENNQQFSHEDVGASKVRFSTEFERGGDGKDGGAEGGKGDDTAERNHGGDDDTAKESQKDEGSDQDDGAGDEKMVIMIHHHRHHHLVHSISATGHKESTASCLNLHH
jgi:hypothetical protein